MKSWSRPTAALNRSSVSGTPSISDSPFQMTPEPQPTAMSAFRISIINRAGLQTTFSHIHTLSADTSLSKRVLSAISFFLHCHPIWQDSLPFIQLLSAIPISSDQSGYFQMRLFSAFKVHLARGLLWRMSRIHVVTPFGDFGRFQTTVNCILCPSGESRSLYWLSAPSQLLVISKMRVRFC
jgi:hypothetical protein